MPIVNAVHALLFEGKKVDEVIKEMWDRELKTEVWE
jgi:glycerol-3-phosphate dehydrogenase (NAD(P)+)